MALGLYGSRVLLEAFPQPATPLILLLTVTISALVGVSLTALAHKHDIKLSSLLALYLYVFWPRIDPTLALGAALVAGIAFTCDNVRNPRAVLSDMLLFVLSLTLYVRTLAPTVLPADSGEFQLVAHVLGIAHPPGYPLYTMLAKLFTLLPFGDVAYRVNLFSAVTGALTLVVLCRALRRTTGSAVAGWIAAAGLGAATTYWAQSTTANIRSLTALFAALQLNALLSYDQSKDHKHLLAFALFFGLGITHHGSLGLLLPVYAAFVWVSDPKLLRRPKALLKPCLAFLCPFLVWLYLPLRSLAGTPFDPAPIRSLSGFLDHVLARGFSGDMFYFTEPTVLLARLRVVLNILMLEFGPILLSLAVLGAAHMFVRDRKHLLLCGGVFAVNGLTAATYRAPQTVEYMIPAYVALAAIWACGARSLSKYLRTHRLSALLLAAALWVPVTTLLRNYPSFVQLSRDDPARQYGEGVLRQAPQGAVVLSNWHYATPMWYLQYVEHMRPDIEVIYVYPEGAAPMAEVWLRRIEENIAQRRTIITNHYPEFATAHYQFAPLGGALAVQDGPVYSVPQDIEGMDALFDDRIRFVGHKLISESVSPAESLAVHLYWLPAVKLERDHSFFVHLVDETGAVMGQGDITHPATDYEEGQVIVDAYRIPLLPTIMPGRYRLIAGAYVTLPEGGWRRLTTEDGADTVTLGEVEVQPMSAAPVTLHRIHRPFACGYTLVGADYDHSLPRQRRVYLHWLSDGRATQEQRLVLLSEETTQAVGRLPVVPAGKYVTTAHDLPLQVTGLALEVQSVTSEVPSALLGPWKAPVSNRVRLPKPSGEERYVCLGGEMILVSAEYPATAPRDGAPLRTRMTFVGAAPITHDYSVSLSLAEETNAWRTQHDGTPALGAIPTLKWIRGVTVRDEHSLKLPPGAAGHGVLRLAVYDAFTMRPLPVLDERLARLGQGTHIELGGIEVR